MHIGGGLSGCARASERFTSQKYLRARKAQYDDISRFTLFTPTPGLGNLRGTHSFPDAAHKELQNTQMRRNVGARHQDDPRETIERCRENALTGKNSELAGSALKADVMARLPELLEEFESERHCPRRSGPLGA